MADALLQRWTALGRPAAEGRALLARWAEPHRRYHDLRHLAEVLSALDLLGRPPPAVVLAAYWHDAVYDPRAPDNERRSAELVSEALDGPLRDEVVRLVLLTTGHDPAPGDRHGALLCDADLAVLASDPDRYAAYAQAVREEYAHVPDPDFRSGRSAVLRDLLDRSTLFHTPLGRLRWEPAARANLQAELQQLSGPSGGAARPR